MSQVQMWGGTTRLAQWLPIPDSGMSRSSAFFSDEIRPQNGGAVALQTYANSAQFDMSWSTRRNDSDGEIQKYLDYAQGIYGKGFFYFVDPMQQDQNVFAPNWAMPGLAEVGWKGIYPKTPSFFDTPANDYGYPLRSARYSVTSSDVFPFLDDGLPEDQNSVFTILIPPGQTLHLGAVYLSEGGMGLAVRAHTATGSMTQTIQNTQVTSAPSFTRSYNGNTYRYVKVFISRVGGLAGSIDLTALFAQILPNGRQPFMPRFIQGRGVSGCSFSGGTVAQTYVQALEDRKIISLSAPLTEVEQWMPRRL